MTILNDKKEIEEIEKMFIKWEFIEQDLSEFTNMMKKAIKNTRKKKKISIWLDNYVLARLKAISYEKGLPYQTLINSVLTKFVKNNQVS